MISLTFDTDWMTSEALGTFLQIYPDLPPSTFFLHEYTKGFDSGTHEINPHPTIEFNSKKDNRGELEKQISTKPMGIRPHSCVSSHMLSLEWANSGYRYQSVEVDLGNEKLKMRPLPWGLYEIPIFYMDNMSMWGQINGLQDNFKNINYLERAIDTSNTLIFDFHPIHIALNTKSVEDYQRKKALVLEHKVDPWSLCADGIGVRTEFELALEHVLTNQDNHLKLQDIVRNFEELR